MKGIIIAGGTGSRLDPLTRVTNKNLLPIYDKPLIYYPIDTLRAIGISDIMVVSGRGHAGQYLELLSDGKELGVNISYRIQKEPKGIAQALELCKDFPEAHENIAVILGDNIFEDNKEIVNAVSTFNNQDSNSDFGAKVFLKEVHDPERFGVAKVDSDKKIVIDIVEKPKNPETKLAVTGLYLYDSQVWDFIKKLRPSKRGELEITDVNKMYCDEGRLTYSEVTREWIDCGTFDSMLKASILAARTKGFDFKY